jgi:hypothetical protein
MPIYGTVQGGGQLTQLSPGDSMALFAAESPAPVAASIPFCRAMSPSSDDAGTTFQIEWATAPTAVLDSVAIQGSNVDTAAAYETLYVSNGGAQYDNYTDLTRFLFYRAILLAESSGGAVTVLVQR